MNDFNTTLRTSATKMNRQLLHPMVTWGMIAAIVIGTGTGTFWISGLEAHAKANTTAIEHEKDLRVAAADNLEDNQDEMKDDLKELRKEMKEDNQETQELLREILRQQNAG